MPLVALIESCAKLTDLESPSDAELAIEGFLGRQTSQCLLNHEVFFWNEIVGSGQTC